MKLVRTWEMSGDFETLLKISKSKDHIILFEGEFDEFRSSPKGVVIQKGEQFLLNGETLICECECYDWKSSPHNPLEIFTVHDKGIYINGKEKVFGDPFDGFCPDLKNPRGVIVEYGDEFLYNGHDLICKIACEGWAPDPTSPRGVITQSKNRIARNGVDVIHHENTNQWEPYKTGIFFEVPSGDKIYFTDKKVRKLVYEDPGSLSTWKVHPEHGVLISDSEKISLIVWK